MSQVPLNDLHRAYSNQREAIKAAVARVLESGWYIHGPEHEAFEQELAAYVGVAHCIGVGNGTDALELALRAAGKAGGTVVAAANAGGYASAAARLAGFRVRYADVDPTTMCLTAATLGPALEDATAVVVTHLYGQLAQTDDIMDLCRPRNVPVIEDCAQATGARRNGSRAGSFGDIAIFSFYPTKNLGALGDGGAIVTDDDDYAATLRQLRQYGWTTKYVVGTAGGRNSRLDELQAAVLRIRLSHLDAQNEQRRTVNRKYENACNKTGVRILPAHTEDHVAHLSVLVADNRTSVQSLLARAGIATAIHYPVPDHRQPYVRAEYGDVSLPATEYSAEHVLSLPCFPELTRSEIDQVCNALATL